MKTILQEFSVKFSYPVHFTENLFGENNSLFAEVIKKAETAVTNKVLFVIDNEVHRHFAKLSGSIKNYQKNHSSVFKLCCAPIVITGGEKAKNDYKVFEKIVKAINDFGICRHSFVVAIGGGAMLDAVGFATSVSHRGVRFIRVPTTVLSQNDAGIGVKNGINYFGKKNFAGTFSPPFAVINDFSFLSTLPVRDWRAGVAEAIKVGLIKDKRFFEFVKNNSERLLERDALSMKELIHRCAEIHLQHIAGKDPFESGTSRPLDFGHWSAHKLEQLTRNNVRHGEAVAAGMALDCTYSFLSGLLPEKEWREILSVIKKIGFRLYYPQFANQNVLKGLEEFREHLGGKLTIMLLKNIGEGIEVHELNKRLITKSISLLKDEDSK